MTRNGFTVIEIVIVLALVSILAGLGLFVGLEFYRNSALEAELDILVAGLRKARAASLHNIGGVPHGLAVLGDRYVLFSGGSYALRDPALDEDIGRGVGMQTAGLEEVVFGQFSATSSASGTIALSDGMRERAIDINYEGRISW